MGADCKSVGLRLHWFESSTCHQGQRLFWATATGLKVRPSVVRSNIEGVRDSVEVIRKQMAVFVQGWRCLLTLKATL
jgi:hypothetical protein